MKKLMMMVCLLLLNSFVFAQKNQVHIDSIMENQQQNLIHSYVMTLDSNFNIDDIKERIDNWAAVNFVDSRAVGISETRNQIVYVYSTNFYHKVFGIRGPTPWYIRLVIQFKDNKIRFLFFDDGNVYIPGSYVGRTYIPATQARSRYLRIDCFYDFHWSRPMYKEALVALKTNIKTDCYNLERVILEKQDATDIKWE